MLKLPYHTGYLELNLTTTVNILEPNTASFKPEQSQEEIVRASLKNPISSQLLSDMVKGKNNIVIITSDHTRPVPSHITMPILLEEISKGNPNAKITLLISTGTHRAMTEEEISKRFGEDVIKHVNVVNHIATDMDNMEFMGKLPSGGELWLNKIALAADLLLAEGFIEPHFFAGFSGGRKSVLPGIASLRSVMYNHNAQFIADPNARAGSLEHNPIHTDMLWAAEQAKLAFILNVVINAKKEIIYCVAGHPFEAHYKGCEFVKELTAVKAKPADIVIVTNGGYPLDQNVYQAVKGMTAGEASANPGAVIIMIAGCKDGLGGEHFYKLLADSPSAKETYDKISNVPREKTEADQWESQILARVLSKHTVIMVTNPELAQDIKNMHMDFAETLEEALKKAKSIKGENASITVIPDGVGIIVEA